MTFDQRFKADEVISRALPGVVSERVASAGTFEDGLFSILDEGLSSSTLSSWRWLLGHDAVALAADAFGDLFFWSDQHRAVYFLEVQHGKSTFVDKDIGFFFDQFLVNEGVLESVLHRKRFTSLAGRLGKLRYGECYITEPWPRLGGSGDVDTYTRGGLDVYASLVGQAVEQTMRMERSRVR